ncbi:hypothetical protein [Arthrobacter mobilis]|uniref:Antibiotic biosynthesis monooxygenase n=1 Tax=Arthrobacter mobilis TaxID=2724944 RepID=A0A7X6HGB9_9MICC|nr:hypothetical protein [Arthrobacter mobilis]NKX55506.1 hypothetical protein [Arthrobacter mobilis]
MFTMQVGYSVRDYAAWKELFDKDPVGRAASGARSYRIFRDSDDENYVVVHLDFDTRDAAASFLEKLRSQVFNNPDAMATIIDGPPSVRILEEAASERLSAG